VSLDASEVGSRANDDGDLLTHERTKRLPHLLHDRAQVEYTRLPHLLSTEREELARENRRSRRGLQDLLDVLEHSIVRREAHSHDVGIAHDCRKEVAEIVRDTTG